MRFIFLVIISNSGWVEMGGYQCSVYHWVVGEKGRLVYGITKWLWGAQFRNHHVIQADTGYNFTSLGYNFTPESLMGMSGNHWLWESVFQTHILLIRNVRLTMGWEQPLGVNVLLPGTRAEPSLDLPDLPCPHGARGLQLREEWRREDSKPASNSFE